MPALEIRGLQKRYGRVQAVRDVSLTVEAGDVYGLLGPNGSGKTTTMACALGLLRQDAGEVRILGVPADRIWSTRGRVAALFDDATLVAGLSVRGNLEYARRLLGHDGGRGVDEVLELAGIESLASQRASGLSLGQGRRLSIARTLLGAPELVILDEPLSGLDTVGVLEVLELFERLRGEGLTLVVSSHRMHELERVVGRLAILLEGRIVVESTLDELLGGQGTLRVEAAPTGRAVELLSRVDGLGSVESRDGDELRVELGGARAAEVTRALVEGGCDLTAVVPERRNLHAVFEEVLREHALVGKAGTEVEP